MFKIACIEFAGPRAPIQAREALNINSGRFTAFDF
jgi:hypothetical protein